MKGKINIKVASSWQEDIEDRERLDRQETVDAWLNDELSTKTFENAVEERLSAYEIYEQDVSMDRMFPSGLPRKIDPEIQSYFADAEED